MNLNIEALRTYLDTERMITYPLSAGEKTALLCIGATPKNGRLDNHVGFVLIDASGEILKRDVWPFAIPAKVMRAAARVAGGEP